MAIRFEDLEPGDFQPASIDGGLPKLVRIWEHLRDLNTGGYGGAVLVDVKNATSKGKSGVTSCSPFTATCIYMALDGRPFDPGSPWEPKEPYEPIFDGGNPLDANFYRLHNGFGLSTYANVKGGKFGGWKADFQKRFVDRVPQLARDFSAFQFINHSAGSVIAFNLGKPVDPKRMRRGDMVGIDWHNGHGHATFCWNVHLDANGEVDCFQFISSNGTAAGGAGITIFRYPDVDPAYLERSGGKYKKKKDMFAGIVDDPKAYPDYVQKPYWWFGLPGVKKGDIDLDSFGVPARSVQISYADSMDVSVHVVHVSRLHGVVPPEPYLRADGGKTPEPQEVSKPKPVAKAQAKKANGAPQGNGTAPAAVQKAEPGPPHPVQEELERQLQRLWKARWIAKDPGDPGSVNDPESQAAIRDYQERFMNGDVPQLGHADPKTRGRIAKAAASAAAMPMVNAALQLAHQSGEIDSAPGADPMQLDDATRAAVKEFQGKQQGLDVDGIPGPLTQARLSAFMKAAAKGAPAKTQPLDQPPPPPPAKDQPAPQGPKDQPAPPQGAKADAPGVPFWYFQRNYGRKGKPITVSVKVYLPEDALDGKTYSITLLSKDGKELAKDAGKVTIQKGKGSVDIPLPAAAGPGSVLKAKVTGNGMNLDVWGDYTVSAAANDEEEIAEKIVASVTAPLPEPPAPQDPLPKGIYVQLWLNAVKATETCYQGETDYKLADGKLDLKKWLTYHCARLRRIGVTGVVLHDGNFHPSIVNEDTFDDLAAAVNPPGETELQVLASWYIWPASDGAVAGNVAALESCKGVMFDPEKEFIVQPSTAPQAKAYLKSFEEARGKSRHAAVWCQPLWQPSDYKKFPWCEFDSGIDAWAPQLYTAVYGNAQSRYLKLFNDEFVGMSARTLTTVTGYQWRSRGHGIDDFFAMLSMELEQRGGPGKIVLWCEPYDSGEWADGRFWKKPYPVPHVEQAIAAWNGLFDYTNLFPTPGSMQLGEGQPLHDEMSATTVATLATEDDLKKSLNAIRGAGGSLARWLKDHPSTALPAQSPWKLNKGQSPYWYASTEDLQRRLKAMGFTQMGVDGSYGNQCDRAVAALKKALIAMPDARKNKAVRALAADGTADRNFWLALGALEAAGAKA
ncbi:MAG TPA: peptidoglycan-binding domain-containing protein [Myxococcales bacterium]|nr:peptidoglycan-binding domain-containing protein [Myxococcales bacterium]